MIVLVTCKNKEDLLRNEGTRVVRSLRSNLAGFQAQTFHVSWTFLVLQQQQNLGRRLGTSKMHLRPPPPVAKAAVRFKAVVLLLLTFCLLLLPLWESVIVLCFVVRYFMPLLVLKSSWRGRESWLLCLICLPRVSWWLSGSSLQCHGFVCGLWLWYFLIILAYYFCGCPCYQQEWRRFNQK